MKLLFMNVAVLLGVLVLLAAPVRADPFPPADFQDAAQAIFFTAIVNLPVDLFLFSLLLYVVYHEFGIKAGKMTAGRARFIELALLGGVVIAVFGALIDFSFFYHHAGPSSYYFRMNFGAPLVSGDSPVMAMLLVLGSVYFCSVLVTRLNRVLSLVPSFVIGYANLFMWAAFANNHDIGSMQILALLFVPLAIAVVFLLMRWHRGQFPEKDATRASMTPQERKGFEKDSWSK